MYSVFHIEGGLGKHVAATAIAKCIKNNYPDRKLIVVCAYPEIFVQLPFVDRVYRVGNTPYFYQNYIENQDTLVFKHEPYDTVDHIYKKLPLLKNWCKLYNLQYNGEIPELRFNASQQHTAATRWPRQKPIMIIQTNGGPMEGQGSSYTWTRDLPMPVAIQVANHFSQRYHIVQITRNKDLVIPGAEVISEPMSNMELFGLLLFSQKQLLIDSCMQHAAAALGKKSTVVWIGTSPRLFGYNIHDNIEVQLPHGLKLPDSYLFDYGFNGMPHECPFDNFDIFDVNQIIESLSD